MKKQMLLALLLAVGVGAVGCDGPEAPHEHSFGDWVKVDNNTHSRSCECGETESENHSWGEGTVTTPPSHTSVGVRTFTCSGCGATKTEDEPMLTEHVYGSWIDEVPATCTEAGVKGHYHCTCGLNFDAQKEVITDLAISAKGHNVTDAVETAKVAAGCETDGAEAYYKCPDCNVYFKDAELTEEIGDATALATWLAGEGKISAKGHDVANATHTEQVNKTCDTSGTKEYYKCPDCNLYFKDADLAEKIGDATALATWLAGEGKIDAGHTSYVKHEAVAAGYDGGNVEYYTCPDCGKLLISDGQGGYTEKTAAQVVGTSAGVPAANEINNFTYADGVTMCDANGLNPVKLTLKGTGNTSGSSDGLWLEEYEGKSGVAKFTAPSTVDTDGQYITLLRPTQAKSVYEAYDSVKITYRIENPNNDISWINLFGLTVNKASTEGWAEAEIPMETYLIAFDASTYEDIANNNVAGKFVNIKYSSTAPTSVVYIDSVEAFNKYEKTVMINDYGTESSGALGSAIWKGTTTLYFNSSFNGHQGVQQIEAKNLYANKGSTTSYWQSLTINSAVTTVEELEDCDVIIVRMYLDDPNSKIWKLRFPTTFTGFTALDATAETRGKWVDFEYSIDGFKNNITTFAAAAATTRFEITRQISNETTNVYIDSIFAAKKIAA